MYHIRLCIESKETLHHAVARGSFFCLPRSCFLPLHRKAAGRFLYPTRSNSRSHEQATPSLSEVIDGLGREVRQTAYSAPFPVVSEPGGAVVLSTAAVTSSSRSFCKMTSLARSRGSAVDVMVIVVHVLLTAGNALLELQARCRSSTARIMVSELKHKACDLPGVNKSDS